MFDPAKLEWMNGQYLSATPRRGAAPGGRARAGAARRALERARSPAAHRRGQGARREPSCSSPSRVAVRLDAARVRRDEKGEQLLQEDGRPVRRERGARASDARAGWRRRVERRPAARALEGRGRGQRAQARRPRCSRCAWCSPDPPCPSRSTSCSPWSGGRRAFGGSADGTESARGYEVGGALLAVVLAVALAACSTGPAARDHSGAGAGSPADAAARRAGSSRSRSRRRRPARPARLPVRLAFVGDINLGTSTLPDGVPLDSGRTFLAGRAAVPERATW